jgi:hypothetical protein
MPFTEIKRTPFNDEVIDRKYEINDLNGNYEKGKLINKIGKKHDQEIIGSGRDSVVIPIEGSNDVVEAFDYSHDASVYMAKNMYYTHKMLSKVFPHNFPKIYASFGAKYDDPEDERVTGTIREKIKSRDWIAFIKARSKGTAYKYPISEMKKTSEEIGMPVYLDEGIDDNFIVNEKGEEMYVDRTYADLDTWDLDKIKNYMEKNNYKDRDVRIVENSFNRLKELDKEQDESLKKLREEEAFEF